VSIKSSLSIAGTFAFLLIAFGCDRKSEPPAGFRSEPEPNGAQAAPASTVRNSAPAPSEGAEPARLEPKLRPAGDLVYLEFVTGGAKSEDRLPLIVAMHGLGDRPESFAGVLDQFDVPARVVVPRALEPYSDGFSWFEYGDGTDEARISRGVQGAVEKIARAITQIVRERPTRGKPIVTGFSQGGILSFAIAVLHPELVSAAFPISGELPSPLLDKAADASVFPPITALHGTADARIPFARAERTVLSLKKRHVSVDLKSYPGTPHTISPDMRAALFQLLRTACAKAAR
jgi:phospholipase/carboxylesterase